MLAERWGEGKSKGGGEDLVLPCLWATTTTEQRSQPQQPSVGLPDSGCSMVGLAPQPSRQDTGPIGLQTQLRGSWGSPAAGGRAMGQSWISSLTSCPQAQQPQCWLLAFCQLTSAAAQELAEGVPWSLLPLLGHPHTPSYLGVPFIHRAVHREGNDWEEKERESWGHFSVLRGEPSPSWPGSSRAHHLFAPPQNCAPPNEMLGLVLFPFPGSCPMRVSPRGCT